MAMIAINATVRQIASSIRLFRFWRATSVGDMGGGSGMFMGRTV